jgi:hypothetical protein
VNTIRDAPLLKSRRFLRGSHDTENAGQLDILKIGSSHHC